VLTLKKGSLEARVVEALGGGRVLKARMLAKELNVKESILAGSLKKLNAMRLVGVDVLPDCAYVRLLGRSFHVEGVKPTQKKELVKKTSRQKAKDYEGVMFR
jgi:hypothetical protein